MNIEYILHLISIACLAYLIYGKSYLVEKGKNTAQLQDSEKLTTITESVRIIFLKEIELVKSNLQSVINDKISYRNEKRIAIITFHSLINHWIYSVKSFSLMSYSDHNLDLLIENIYKNDELY